MTKVWMVKCPCCPPEDWSLFSDIQKAFDHAENRKEYNQIIYEIELSKEAVKPKE